MIRIDGMLTQELKPIDAGWQIVSTNQLDWRRQPESGRLQWKNIPQFRGWSTGEDVSLQVDMP